MKEYSKITDFPKGVEEFYCLDNTELSWRPGDSYGTPSFFYFPAYRSDSLKPHRRGSGNVTFRRQRPFRMRRLGQEAPHRTVHLTATFRSGPAVQVTHKGERRAESDRRVGCGDCGHRPGGWPRWGLRSGSREGRTCRTEAHGRGVRCPQTAHHVQLQRRG